MSSLPFWMSFMLLTIQSLKPVTEPSLHRLERMTPLAHFIDYGDSAIVPLSDIHTCPESVRDTPPMAMKCGLKLNVPDDFHWTPGLVRVLKAVAEEEETLEAVFCEEVDGVKLIRSLKTKKQDLIKLIEENILNPANSPQEAEVDQPAEAVEQEVAEECLEPAADDQPNEETGADADVGNVAIEHLPVEDRIVVSVTLYSDAPEGVEFVNPPVDAAEPEEHNSFDHSIGTDSGLAESAGNDYSEGSSRRNSVADKIAYMESLIYAKLNSPTSPTPDIVVSSRMPYVAATSVDSAIKCEPIASIKPEAVVDSSEVLVKEQADLGDCSDDTENREQIEVAPTTATTRLDVVACVEQDATTMESPWDFRPSVEEDATTTESPWDFRPQATPVECDIGIPIYHSNEMDGLPIETFQDSELPESEPFRPVSVREEEPIPEIEQLGADYVTEETTPSVVEEPIPEIENPGAVMQEESTVDAEEEPVLQIEPDASEDFETSSGTEQVVGSFETPDNQVVHSL